MTRSAADPPVRLVAVEYKALAVEQLASARDQLNAALCGEWPLETEVMDAISTLVGRASAWLLLARSLELTAA